MIEVTDYLKLD